MVNTMVALIITDETGEMLKTAFGLTAEELTAKNVSVTLTHPVPETVKLDTKYSYPTYDHYKLAIRAYSKAY